MHNPLRLERPIKLLLFLTAFFVANALIAECIGVKLFSLERFAMLRGSQAGKHFEAMFYPLKSHRVTGAFRLHMLETMTGFFDRTLMAK